MLYQTLIGAWPDTVDEDFVKRMQAYALKAAREGKQQTSWTNPNEGYEKALTNFVQELLDPKRSQQFLSSFGTFAARTNLLGALNGLSQLALKVLSPGVPDFYQGTELWDYSLVDPDNRRPVDYAVRNRELLDRPADWPSLPANWTDSRPKLQLTQRLLKLRHELPELFRVGSYEPIVAAGQHADHVIAFTRRHKRQQIVVLIGRHFAALTNGGRQTWLELDAYAPTGADTTYVDVLRPSAGRHNGKLALPRGLPIGVFLSVDDDD
jgi:(1->4)-alpha-D-glucan 1-alpha-D-glucosylmutase